MLDSITDCGAEYVEDDLADDQKEYSKSNISQRPAILQCVHHKDDLHNNIYQYFHPRNQVKHNEQANCMGRAKTGPRFESCQRNQARNDKHNKADDSEEPDGKCGAVLV